MSNIKIDIEGWFEHTEFETEVYHPGSGDESHIKLKIKTEFQGDHDITLELSDSSAKRLHKKLTLAIQRADPEGCGLCEHGVVTTEEYCDPCALAAMAAEESSRFRSATKLHKRSDVVDSESPEMVSLIFETPYKRLVYTIERYLNSRELAHEKHAGRGLYYDVHLHGIKYMFDPTPEDQKGKVPEGLLVVRDGTHMACNPTRRDSVLLYSDGAYEALDQILDIL